MGAGVYPTKSTASAPTASATLNMPPTLSVLRIFSKRINAIMVYCHGYGACEKER